jgi:hypothetical protein
MVITGLKYKAYLATAGVAHARGSRSAPPPAHAQLFVTGITGLNIKAYLAPAGVAHARILAQLLLRMRSY